MDISCLSRWNCGTGARVKELTGSDLESPPEVTLEDGTKMAGKRGIVVATDQPSAVRLLGKALDNSPSKEGKGRGTCNLYFKSVFSIPPSHPFAVDFIPCKQHTSCSQANKLLHY